MWETQRLQLRYFTDICLDMLRKTNECLGHNSGYSGWVAQLWPAEFQTNWLALNRNVAQVTCQTQASSKGHCTAVCVCACAPALSNIACQKLRLYSVSDIMELWWDGCHWQGKSELLRTDVSQCCFIQHKSHMFKPGSNPALGGLSLYVWVVRYCTVTSFVRYFSTLSWKIHCISLHLLHVTTLPVASFMRVVTHTGLILGSKEGNTEYICAVLVHRIR
jgi:hypothetical protein